MNLPIHNWTEQIPANWIGKTGTPDRPDELFPIFAYPWVRKRDTYSLPWGKGE